MKPVRNLKLADAIAEHLEQLILEGALRPGEKLAPERELAERLEVSRPSLREALEKLQARGLLETSKSGTHVTKFMAPLTEPLAAMMQSNEQALIDYLEYRSLVEGEAAQLAAIRATDIEIDAIRACLNRMREAHKIDDPSAEAEVDADLHMLVYEASHNIVMLPSCAPSRKCCATACFTIATSSIPIPACATNCWSSIWPSAKRSSRATPKKRRMPPPAT